MRVEIHDVLNQLTSRDEAALDLAGGGRKGRLGGDVLNGTSDRVVFILQAQRANLGCLPHYLNIIRFVLIFEANRWREPTGDEDAQAEQRLHTSITSSFSRFVG